MTILRDVAELDKLPVTFAFVDSMGDFGVVVFKKAWYAETAPMGVERAIRKYGPLEVLYSPFVSKAEVERLSKSASRARQEIGNTGTPVVEIASALDIHVVMTILRDLGIKVKE